MGGLIDVPGVLVGHRSLGDTGCTVVVTPESAIGAVDVRGGGPGTRETDLLEPHNTVQRVHAVVLSGGSAFGLATADGVMRTLDSRGIGFPVPGGVSVPIVPGAVIFDLLVGDPRHRPTAADGEAAVQDAFDGGSATAVGSVGAGCAATAGVLRGGFGQASQRVGDYVVAAGVVANPVGSVVDRSTGRMWADPDMRVDPEKFSQLKGLETKLNTTIGVIATDAPVTKAQAQRLAMVGHDGIAVAIRPAHSPLDGDTLFAISTGDGAGVDVDTLAQLSRAAAEVVAQAIVSAVVNATSAYGLTALSEIAVTQ
ncbi:P1 family peptidase [Corynebacterium rouxii]|uniref:P1 family peptidase n=1 Tax=Corynebacterium rouxii TaxID=2719119 RepID=A0A6I8MG66_9CORY|nr:P1 family peptidase [Corynebacterium rouxii]MDT9409413.1 P1 family peptidase [Corynebacterium rouxii]MDT9411646.1 P1 family peptidase [Corynebacterium rouxii]VZH85953.1 peptidase S58 family protein [Corynebacterium rouxii]